MKPEATVEQQRTLVEALCHALAREGDAELMETHISWVVLAGEFAYKIKKAVNFGFLDYSTLALRHHWCLEELRVNRRTAENIYLQVIGIGGPAQSPRLGADPPVEWAVKMRRFSQASLLDGQLREGRLTLEAMDALASSLAGFHSGIPAASAQQPYGEPADVYGHMTDNFPPIRAALGARAHEIDLERYETWTRERYQTLIPRLMERKARGFVRECHGDLHLGNILKLDDRFVPFDAIEFNPSLRFIDVANELAFLAMDLEARGEPAYARRVVNTYLEITGDYEALTLLEFYKHYRAMVRAKVAALRLAQPTLTTAERMTITEQFGAYLALANEYQQPPRPAVVITCGVSGSGKTRVAGAVVEHLPRAVRLRSDVERKRLFHLGALAPTHSSLAEGVYSQEATHRTYTRLAELATLVTEAGYTAVVDATFLRREQRQMFRDFANGAGVPFVLIDVTAPEPILRERITARLAAARDASEANLDVLAHQLAGREPLSQEEEAYALRIDTAGSWEGGAIAERIVERIQR